MTSGNVQKKPAEPKPTESAVPPHHKVPVPRSAADVSTFLCGDYWEKEAVLFWINHNIWQLGSFPDFKANEAQIVDKILELATLPGVRYAGSLDAETNDEVLKSFAIGVAVEDWRNCDYLSTESREKLARANLPKLTCR